MSREGSGVTVVLCTRNRSAGCVTALQSLVAMQPSADAILVIDQSDDRSNDVIGTWCESVGGSVKYVRQAEVGLSRARNLALSESTTDVVVFTDDDCEVPADFIAKVSDACNCWPNAGLIFGNVRPGPHDAEAGLIPSVERTEVVVASGIPDQRNLGAMGACMVLRRGLLPPRASFDPCLGAGGMLHAGEDTDFILRCLAAGIPVVETPSLEVLHHGFRTWAEAEVLADHYLFGTAAVYAKYVRLHPLPMLSLLSHIGARWSRGTSHISYFGTRKRRGERLASFLRGFARGLRLPIDPATGHFVA